MAGIATFGDFCGVSAGNKRGQKNLSFGHPVDKIVLNYANLRHLLGFTPMDSAILSPVSPVDNFCPRLVMGTKFINNDNNLGHLLTACPRCPRQKMSIPKEKQFLPEMVPMRYVAQIATLGPAAVPVVTPLAHRPTGGPGAAC